MTIQISEIKTYKFIKIKKEEWRLINNRRTLCKNKTTVPFSQHKISRYQYSQNNHKSHKILGYLLHKNSSNPSLTRLPQRKLSFTQVPQKSLETGNTKIKTSLHLSKNIISTLICKTKVNATYSRTNSDR